MAQLETPPSPEALAAAVGRPPEPQLDPRAGYVVDLVSTLLVELIALTAQTKANGGRLKQNLLIRMLYNAREEWAAMLGKILRRTVQLAEWREEGKDQPHPSPIFDLQIYHHCRAMHFLCITCRDPCFRHAIRDDGAFDTLFKLQLDFSSEMGRLFLELIADVMTDEEEAQMLQAAEEAAAEEAAAEEVAAEAAAAAAARPTA
jgi:hypothetical protein